MKKLFLPIAAVSVAMLVSCNNQQSTSSSDVSISVGVTDVELSSIAQTIESNGTLKPTGEVELSTETEGKYSLQKNPATGKAFKLGDKVKAGDVIVVVENEEYVNSIRIETQKLNMDISKSEYEKQNSLYQKGGVTLREMSDAEVSYLNSKFDYESSLMQLEKMKVIAPFDGYIVSLPYFTDGVKNPSSTVVCKLMAYQNMVMSISLPEKYLPTVKVGQKARITNYNVVNDTLDATITQLSPAIDENTRTFEGVLSVDNSKLSFRPGMFVKVCIETQRKDSVIVIPLDVIRKNRRGQVVYVVDRLTANEKQVITGIESGDYVEVIKGLEIGERLVTDGYEMLSNRSKVKIK